WKDLDDPGAEHGDGEAHVLGHGREVVACAVQRLSRAVSVDHGDVLDPHTEAAGDVHAWLDRERHPGLEGFAIPAHEIGIFVAVETDPVPGPMDEELAVSGLVDDASRR